jgi:pyrimidine-specific ribonucleoside hydrolase
MALRVWVDTDVGDDPDDAIALLCAAGHPEVDLVGVSTVGGDHDRRVRIARALVDAPVHRGDEPGLGDVVVAAAPDAVLAIGPLTNVAALLAAGPIPPVTLMGGALAPIRHWAKTIETEYNFGRDPDAAATVLETADPLVVPLDVTVSTCLDAETLGHLVAAAPALREPIDGFLRLQRDVGVPIEDRSVCLHDPLALLALVEPALVRVETRTVRVEGDGRLVDDPRGTPCRIVSNADVPRVIELVLRYLARNPG